ncbi:Rifampicin monooxygenase-like protein [Pleurotus pulmonarius]
MSHSVLVVGAGPTGLVLAISLALNGVKVRVIEKDTACKVGQRGAGIHPRSLEMHHFLGTAPDILSSASQVPQMAAYPIGGTVPIKTINLLSDAAEPSDAFPTTRAVLLGQDKQVEILTSHFQKLGGLVERGVELVSFEQTSDNVSAVLRHHGGHGERATFSYLVGADGARSQTRKQLGLSFLGETRKAQQMIIGDVYIRGSLSQNTLHMWGDMSSSFLSLRPVPETPGLFFLFTPGYEENLCLISNHEDLISYLRKMTGLPDLVCDKSTLLTTYTPNIRMVDSFRKGRVFIAGDAAHVHSPAGGQGSNSGAQDAFNLGWKLALVVKGLAKPKLLDSYDAERLPVIAEMLQLTSALHDKTYEGGPSEQAWKRGSHLDQLGVNYRGTPFVLDEIKGRPPSTSNCYDSRPSGVLMAGDRAPDASSLVAIRGVLTSDRLFDIFSATRHTILIFTRQQGDPEASRVVELLKAYPSGLFKSVGVLPSGSTNIMDVGVDLVVKDGQGNAHKAYGAPSADTFIVVVRPDGVVGAMIADSNGLRRYLELACF